MELNDLTGLGLTVAGSKVFYEIIELGNTSAEKIINRTGLHRGTVYSVLKRLADEGFVSSRVEDGLTLFAPNKQALLDLISSEKEEIALKEKTVEELKQKIDSVRNKHYYEPKIKTFIGEKSFNLFFKEMILNCHKTGEIYYFLGRGNEMLELLGEDYYAWSQEFKRNLNVKTNAILDLRSKDKPVMKHIYGNVKFIKWKIKSDSSTWIYSNKVVIVLWNHKPLIMIIITDQDVNNSYRSYFNELWKTAGTSNLRK